MRELVRVAAAAALAAVAISPSAEAAEAKGRLTVDGKVHELKYAYAVSRPDSFDKTKQELEIVLSVQPIPEADLGDMMPGSGPRVAITLDADGKLTGGNVFHERGNMSSNTGHEIAFTTRSDTNVAGRAFTQGEVTGAGLTFQYDVTFSADVWRKPVEQAATPEERKRAAASPQAKAYEAFLKAVKAGDFAGLRTLVTPEMAAQMDDPDFKKMFPLMQEMTPASVAYERLVETGDAATLEVTAEGQGKGTASLRKVGQKWAVLGTKWSMSN